MSPGPGVEGLGQLPALTLVEDGASEVTATASGIRLAFLAGAIISLFVIPLAAFIRRPPDSVEG